MERWTRAFCLFVAAAIVGCCAAARLQRIGQRPHIAALFQGLAKLKQRNLERRQIVLHGFPDNRGVDTRIIVPQNIAYSGNILPTNILVLGFQVAAKMPTGF